MDSEEGERIGTMTDEETIVAGTIGAMVGGWAAAEEEEEQGDLHVIK